MTAPAAQPGARDMLAFQAANWLSATAWYAAFAAHAGAGFAGIAAAEVAWGFVGVFCTATALRWQGATTDRAADRATEHRVIRLRASIAALASAMLVAGVIGLAGALAIVTLCATPAHLPMRLGYRAGLSWPLLMRLPGAAAVATLGLGGLSADALAALYFAPVLLYGLVAYPGYFRRIDAGSPPPEAADARPFGVDALATLVLTACANRLQADVIAGIVARSPGLAIAERLLRSAWSLAYPHLVRRGAAQVWRRRGVALGLSLLLALGLGLHFAGLTAIDPLVPVLLDIYASLLASRALLADLATVTALVAMLLHS